MSLQEYACNQSEEWKGLIILMPVLSMDTGINVVFSGGLFLNFTKCIAMLKITKFSVEIQYF